MWNRSENDVILSSDKTSYYYQYESKVTTVICDRYTVVMPVLWRFILLFIADKDTDEYTIVKVY